MAFAAYSQHPSGFSKKHQLQQRSQWTTLWQIALREESVVFLGPSNQCVSAFEELNVVGLVLAVQELADIDVGTLKSLYQVSTTTLRPRHSLTYVSTFCLAWKIAGKAQVDTQSLVVLESTLLKVVVPFLQRREVYAT